MLTLTPAHQGGYAKPESSTVKTAARLPTTTEWRCSRIHMRIGITSVHERHISFACERSMWFRANTRLWHMTLATRFDNWRFVLINWLAWNFFPQFLDIFSKLLINSNSGSEIFDNWMDDQYHQIMDNIFMDGVLRRTPHRSSSCISFHREKSYDFSHEVVSFMFYRHHSLSRH